jgi:hypothetical protein
MRKIVDITSKKPNDWVEFKRLLELALPIPQVTPQH